MNIVIPMAGQGSRFSQGGFVLPKPLIPIGDIPMYRYVTKCLPLNLASRLIFILRKNGFEEALSADIKQHFSRHLSKIIVLDKATEGQAETVLKAMAEIDFSHPTLIHNCDTYFESTLDWETLLDKPEDAALILFFSTQDQWSYATLNSHQSRVVEIQEKKVISHHASTGTYFFKNSKLLFENLQALIAKKKKEKGEYYMSSICQLMLKNQQQIVPWFAEKVLCFGTP